MFNIFLILIYLNFNFFIESSASYAGALSLVHALALCDVDVKLEVARKILTVTFMHPQQFAKQVIIYFWTLYLKKYINNFLFSIIFVYYWLSLNDLLTRFTLKILGVAMVCWFLKLFLSFLCLSSLGAYNFIKSEKIIFLIFSNQS